MNGEEFFGETINPLITCIVPGRLDVMGGLAEYAGSLVLQMPATQNMQVSLALRNDTTIRMYVQPGTPDTLTEIRSSEWLKPDGSIYLSGNQVAGTHHWHRLLLCCLSIICQRLSVSPSGIDIRVNTHLSDQQGLAASSALSLAMMKALAQAYQLSLNASETVHLAWQAQRLYNPSASLAPILGCDQSHPTHLLPVLCQPGHVAAPVALPEGIRLIGLTTGIAQPTDFQVYEQLRTAALIGYSMIALSDGTFPHELETARQTGVREDLLYNGYLANITPLEFESRYQWLPQQLEGRVFLERSGILIDASDHPDPAIFYPVWTAVSQPIYENIRTQYFSLLLQHLPPLSDAERREKSLTQLGTWMYQSHASYVACGLSHPKADAMVAQLKTLAGKGIYGARLTDRGLGGTICVLCDGEQGLETVQQIQETYDLNTESYD